MKMNKKAMKWFENLKKSALDNGFTKNQTNEWKFADWEFYFRNGYRPKEVFESQGE